MNIVENACDLAYTWHEGQMYGEVPYFNHLSDVVRSLYETSIYDPSTIATAWLHDVLEDTDCTEEEIQEACGDEVLVAVLDISRWDDETNQQYISKVKANPIALEVKKHDTLCNLTASVRSGEKGRTRKYAQQMLLLVD